MFGVICRLITIPKLTECDTRFFEKAEKSRNFLRRIKKRDTPDTPDTQRFHKLNFEWNASRQNQRQREFNSQ